MSAAAHVQPCVGGGLFPPRSASLSAYARIVAPHYWDAGRNPGGGALQTHFPVSAAPRQTTGSLRRGYVDEFYGWTHIQPKELDVGMVATEQFYDVYVWNATLRDKTLSSISGVPPGMELVGDLAPVPFGPLRERLWQLHVTLAGDPDIDTFIHFHFVDETLALHVKALRIAAWSWLPDWTDGVTERLVWATDILQSQSLIEQRRALRTVPRREFDAAFVVAGKDRQSLDCCLFSLSGRAWAVPVWADVQRLAAPCPAGGLFVPCQTALRDFSAPGMAAFVASATQYEVVQTVAVNADGLQIKRPVQQDWPAGTKLYPVRRAVLAEMPELTRHTDQLQEFWARFVCVEDCDWPALPEMPQYRGCPVLEARPDESRPLTSSLFRLREVFDSSSGLPLYTDVAGVGLPVTRWSWLELGRDKMAWLRSLIYALRGQQKGIWVSTHADDMTLVQAAGSETLTIANAFFSRFGGPRCGRRDLRVDMADGRVFYRRIVAASEVDTRTERVQLDASLGDTVLPEDVARISWLTLSRLAADDVSIHHITDEIARVSLTFRGVRDDELPHS